MLPEPFRQRSLLFLLSLGLVAMFVALGIFRYRRSQSALSPQSPVVPTASDRLFQAFQHYCWMTYTPSTFDPTVQPPHWPSREEVVADLQVLSQSGVRGLVTYRADYRDRNQPDSLIPLPELARSQGFQGLILGIWDLDSPSEWEAVKTFANHPLVLGFVAGNEGLDRRYSWETLEETIAKVQTQTRKPTSTSEEFKDYLLSDRLRKLGDWLFPNTHPYFGQVKEPVKAAQWTEDWYLRLQAISDRPLIFKEVGLPTAGDPAVSEDSQAVYYDTLGQTAVSFVFFTAFDLPWKRWTGQHSLADSLNPEPYWGLFDHNRRPKRAVRPLQKQCLPRSAN